MYAPFYLQQRLHREYTRGVLHTQPVPISLGSSLGEVAASFIEQQKHKGADDRVLLIRQGAVLVVRCAEGNTA